MSHGIKRRITRTRLVDSDSESRVRSSLKNGLNKIVLQEARAEAQLQFASEFYDMALTHSINNL